MMVEKYCDTPQRHSGAATRNPESRTLASDWIPAIHSTGVEPCGNDEAADSGEFFNNRLIEGFY